MTAGIDQGIKAHHVLYILAVTVAGDRQGAALGQSGQE
jgi:hypothetical protein